MNRPIREKLSPANLIYRGVPKEYIDATLDQYPIDPEHHATISRYIENMDVMLDDCINLILYGANGAGKTFLSSILVKEAYRRRYSSFRITLQNFIDLQFKKSREEEAREKDFNIRTCEFLVIDEVGKETFDSKSFNIATYEELMRSRDTHGLPTIHCMNLPIEGDGGYYEQYGKSIRSLIHGKAMKMEFTGDDFRHEVTSKKRGIQLLMGE